MNKPVVEKNAYPYNGLGNGAQRYELSIGFID